MWKYVKKSYLLTGNKLLPFHRELEMVYFSRRMRGKYYSRVPRGEKVTFYRLIYTLIRNFILFFFNFIFLIFKGGKRVLLPEKVFSYKNTIYKNDEVQNVRKIRIF